MHSLSVALFSDPEDLGSSSDGKESSCSAEDPGLIPGSGRSPGGGNDYLGNPMDRGAWKARAYGITRVGHDWVTDTHSVYTLVKLYHTLKSSFRILLYHR